MSPIRIFVTVAALLIKIPYMDSIRSLLLLPEELVISLPFGARYDVIPALEAVLVFCALSFLFWCIKFIILNRLRALSQFTRTDMDDVVVSAFEGVRPWVYVLLALYIALNPLSLPTTAAMLLKVTMLAAVVWQVIEIVLLFIEYAAQRLVERDEDGDGVIDPNSATVSDMIRLIARIVLWTLGIIFILSNLGVEVTSLVAGLGIGGIAIAFALQGVLSDLFASFSLYFDRPFRIGDFVVVGEDSGTVEKIGVKSTRLRTLQGEQLVISNAELTSVRVQNFKRMEERRIVTSFGIAYETPQATVEGVNGMVEAIFSTIAGARLDRTHFTTFGDSALLFEVVYHVESADYTTYLDIQQTFNFALMKAFAAEGVEFAYPTQTVYHKEMGK